MAPNSVRAARNETVLVVDDDAPIRIMLRRMLEDEGYDVVLAANGLEALSYCERGLPDLVLLDIGMPDMDGYAFVEEFVRRGWRGRTRLFVLSAQIRRQEDLARMSLLEHLEELRKRIVWSLLAFALACVPSWIFHEEIFRFLERPIKAIRPQEKLIFLGITDPFFLYMKVAALAALFLALPVVLYQLWLFVAPGLYRRERRFLGPFLVFGTAFFVAGGAFAYYVAFPFAAEFLLNMAKGFEMQLEVGRYFGLLMTMILGLGLMFELPIVLLVHLLFTMAVALLLSMANLFYRDVKYLFEVVITVWMFATSVVFPVDQVGGTLGALLRLNPMTPIIDAYRAVLLLNTPPPAALGVAAVISLVGLLGSWAMFHRSEFTFAENI